MTELKIERRGGLAGFGIPNSRLKSQGRVLVSDLSPRDRAAVDALFTGKADRAEPFSAADAFRYVITRQTAAGPQTVEAPESAVPEALRARVKDELE